MENNLLPTFESMAKTLEKNPLKAIRIAQKSNLSVDRMKYEIAAIAYGYAAILRDEAAQRENFYDESFWEGRERTMRMDKLLLHVFIYVYGSDEGGPANRASEHSRALQAAFDANVPFKEIPQHIEESGGFYGLLKTKKADEADPLGPEKEPAASPRPSTKTVTKSDSVAGLSEDDDDGDEGDVEPNDDRPIEPDELDDADEVRVPVRKLANPEVEKPELKLLPRDLLANYMLVRPRAPLTMEDIWQALEHGEKVNADFVKGTTSDTYELYTGGGGFIDVYIEEMVTS